uniref:Uncharacterized protein n=1 Tax=Anthurium amnicola TaxID=1678845 RepID=A0A1D1Y4K7_9ARAE
MKFVITIFLIHKFFDIATAEDTNSSLSVSKISIIVVASIVGIFVIGTLLYCLCCRRRKTKRKRVVPREVKESKKSKPRGGGASTTSSTSKVNIPREGDRLIPDVRLTLTTNPISLIQPSGTTTPSKAPPQTPLTPPQPQHSAIPSSTQTTLARVTESLLEERKASSEVVVTPEVSEEFTSRPRSHPTIIEQRDNLPQSRSSTDLSSRFSLPPTAQTYGQQHSETRDFYPQGTTSVESHLEQVTRSRDTSPYRHQYHEYGTQTFDTPIDPRLQTQSRGLDSSLFTDAPNLPSQQFETSTGDVLQEIGQRQRAPMPPYPAPPPYDEPNIPSTPPERRGRPESTYSFDDNPGSTVPERPIQRSTPGTSPRSRRGRRGGNR